MSNSEEDNLWEEYKDSVKPIEKIQIVKKSKKIKEILINNPSQPMASPLPKNYKYIEAGDEDGVDASTAKKLKSGKMEVDATLDLHGKTKEEAVAELEKFIKTAYQLGNRCILVITGKGKHGEGVLKNMMPIWLNNPGLREYIIMFSYAKIADGGDGALYVLIRRSS